MDTFAALDARTRRLKDVTTASSLLPAPRSGPHLRAAQADLEDYVFSLHQHQQSRDPHNPRLPAKESGMLRGFLEKNGCPTLKRLYSSFSAAKATDPFYEQPSINNNQDPFFLQFLQSDVPPGPTGGGGRRPHCFTLGSFLAFFADAVVHLFADEEKGVSDTEDFAASFFYYLNQTQGTDGSSGATANPLKEYMFELQGFASLFLFLWFQVSSWRAAERYYNTALAEAARCLSQDEELPVYDSANNRSRYNATNRTQTFPESVQTSAPEREAGVAPPRVMTTRAELLMEGESDANERTEAPVDPPAEARRPLAAAAPRDGERRQGGDERTGKKMAFTTPVPARAAAARSEPTTEASRAVTLKGARPHAVVPLKTAVVGTFDAEASGKGLAASEIPTSGKKHEGGGQASGRSPRTQTAPPACRTGRGVQQH
ncbi:hypothetical protein STCU_10908 [Strigomonas culicis]|uniref:Uncharacterized protein n=1 Tax=Strigomonas culicis TaxID=28005 RepID=S9TFR6_9TRYP|nr:hypothetical protein STCU_10908 [Strigomonas culicis]|eukprot:EPY16917.1 hypothetical protein STCU_10908 [Strigomonas culicis]